MSKTPLLDALRAFAPLDRLPMHMPGHKGRPLPVPELAGYSALDVTELDPTGDLYAGGGPIGAAQDLWAQALHMEHCLFLTGGSTQGLLAALTAACPLGSKILLDRGCHRCVYNAMALLDLQPVYLNRPWLAAGVTGPISPEAVDRLLSCDPQIKTICITSPTYYGILSDIPAIAAVVHAHQGVLIVDSAHGAHLPFLGDLGISCADLAVLSAHKTLPAPGQTALLFSNALPHQALRASASLYGSSSPSYPMMAALDGVRAWMEEEGTAAYQAAAAGVARLRRQFPSLQETDAPLDPCRFVLCSGDGPAVANALAAQGIWVEMCDSRHVVLILTCSDGQDIFSRLEVGLTAALADVPSLSGDMPPPPPLPEICLSPRAARFSLQERLPLERAQGRIAACQVAPYPPGVPVVAPGERIAKKTIAYLDQIGYNMVEDIEVVQA